MDTGVSLGKKGRILGHILGEITDLEFENHKKCEQMYFPHTLTNWDKYMFNGIPKLKF